MDRILNRIITGEGRVEFQTTITGVVTQLFLIEEFRAGQDTQEENVAPKAGVLDARSPGAAIPEPPRTIETEGGTGEMPKRTYHIWAALDLLISGSNLTRSSGEISLSHLAIIKSTPFDSGSAE
ncbi:MAG: hypothetical protein M1839_005781 [Geoglossum umbratile]|nr:MAG: hypothetical protein M1839_005781 [Geoglossum umbratile]